jgi:filamentous hemagglutinin
MGIINGKVNYDVYTPITSNVSRMVKAIAEKDYQATGIIVDLSKSKASAADLQNFLQGVRGTGAKNITDIKVINSKPPPNAGN